MAEDGAFGERLRETFGVDAAPVFVARTLKKANVAATEICCDKTNAGFSKPIPVEEAFARGASGGKVILNVYFKA